MAISLTEQKPGYSSDNDSTADSEPIVGNKKPVVVIDSKRPATDNQAALCGGELNDKLQVGKKKGYDGNDYCLKHPLVPMQYCCPHRYLNFEM